MIDCVLSDAEAQIAAADLSHGPLDTPDLALWFAMARMWAVDLADTLRIARVRKHLPATLTDVEKKLDRLRIALTKHEVKHERSGETVQIVDRCLMSDQSLGWVYLERKNGDPVSISRRQIANAILSAPKNI